MALTLVPDASAGHEAGDAAQALAAGAVSAGVVFLVTGAQPQPGNGVLLEVSFSVDDTGASPNPNEIGAAHAFVATQNTTGTGLGAALTGVAVQSTQQGFTITATGALPHTAYLFSWTG